jgi:HK97 family phage prohead protease
MTIIQRPDLETRQSITGEIRAIRADAKQVRLAGYAAVYDTKSQPICGMFCEIVRRGAFERALKGQDDVRALLDHDSSVVLGRTASRTLRLSDDEKGLKFELDVPDTQAGRDLVTSVERGDISQMSFGFRKIKDKWGEERTPDGIVVEVRELLEVELIDVSPVAFAAYLQTEVAMRSLGAFRAQRTGQASAVAARRLRVAEAELGS